MLSPSKVMRTLDAMGVEDFLILTQIDGGLVVIVEEQEPDEPHDRLFFYPREGEDGAIAFPTE